MRLRSLAGVTLLAVAACGGDDASSSVDAVAESHALFGNDRVGDALKGKPKKVPGTFAQVEALFGIGRACERTDSNEIFVVEESQTRAGGEQSPSVGLMPRAVVTGCSTDPSSRADSYSLLVALVSSPDAPGAPDGDPMLLSPVEMMALDRKTGLYNFYVFESNGQGKPGTVSRIQRLQDDTIVRRKKVPGKPLVTEPEADRECQNCHVAMGPLMNELTEPWTNWVSTHKRLPKTELSGDTAAIVAEAGGEPGRSSFANELERIMREAMRVWVDGRVDAPGTGFGDAVLAGHQPGGLPRLLRSVFCETELNYQTAFDTVPVSLFVDGGAAASAGIAPVHADAVDLFPLMLPVRSELDVRVERFLMRRKYLSVRTVVAIRLIDDTRDVFSATRCDLYEGVLEGLPEAPVAVEEHIRAVVSAALEDGSVPAGPRANYIAALIDTGIDDAALKAAQAAYVASATTLYDKETGWLETTAGMKKLQKRATKKKLQARAMFAGAKVPLPVLDPDPPKVGGPKSPPLGAPPCAHDECVLGDALDARCSSCAVNVCAQDGFCCGETWDETCVSFAETTAACACP